MDCESISTTHSVFINEEAVLSDDQMEDEKPKEAEEEKPAAAPTFELMVYKEDDVDSAGAESKDPLGQQEADNDSSIDYYSSDGLLKRIKLEKVKLIEPEKKEVEEKTDIAVNDKNAEEASVTGIVDIYSPTSNSNSNSNSKSKSKPKGLTCFACKELFTDTNLFKDHLTTHSEEENIFCGECKKTFKSIHGLIFHVNNHPIKVDKTEIPNDKNSVDNLLNMMKGPYICKICRAKCWDIASFKNHVAVHTNKEKTYECNKCKRVFLNLKKLMNHVCQSIPKQRPERSVTLVNPKAETKSPLPSKIENDAVYYTYNPPPFPNGEYHNTCFKCCTSFNDYYDLKVHVATCEGLYKCPPCQKAFMLEYKMLCHTQFHKILRPFQCDKCNLEFLSLNSFKIHLVGHGAADFYQCMLCEKRFEHKGSLIYHSFGHMEKNFVCSYCGKEYDRQTEMQYHKVRMHSKTDKTYRCSHCHEQLPNSIRLRQHVAKFHKRKGTKHFKCDDCDQQFMNSINLDRHKMIHHPPPETKRDSKFLQCDICYKRFLKLELLETHRLYHNENLLECEYCGRKFLDDYQMNLHVCTENKHKVYKCALCDKGFPRPTALGSHMRVHRNEELKRLAEGNAQMKIEQGEGSMAQFASQEREKVYECKVCNRIFFRLTALRSHMRVHGDEDGVEDFPEPAMRDRGDSFDATTDGETASSEAKPYSCHVCHRGFAKATGLGSHLRTHKAAGIYVPPPPVVESEPEEMDYPEYFTLETLPPRMPEKAKVNNSTPGAIKKEKKFECPECGKIYNQPHFLGSHMRLHRNEKMKVGPNKSNLEGANSTEDMDSSTFDDSQNLNETENNHEESNIEESKNETANTTNDVNETENSTNDLKETDNTTNDLKETENSTADLNDTADSAANDSSHNPNVSFSNSKLNFMKGPDGQYRCAHCDKPFYRPAALGSHLRIHKASNFTKAAQQPEVKEDLKSESDGEIQKLDNHENNDSEKMEVDSTPNHVDSAKMEAEPIASH